MKDELQNWLESGMYLPEQMRDFHNQKDLFKAMHFLYEGNESLAEVPSWRAGHMYTIDCFLWFMASRGYTLQQCRKKNVEFRAWPNYRELVDLSNLISPQLTSQEG